jgi:hypothetical protein
MPRAAPVHVRNHRRRYRRSSTHSSSRGPLTTPPSSSSRRRRRTRRQAGTPADNLWAASPAAARSRHSWCGTPPSPRPRRPAAPTLMTTTSRRRRGRGPGRTARLAERRSRCTSPKRAARLSRSRAAPPAGSWCPRRRRWAQGRTQLPRRLHRTRSSSSPSSRASAEGCTGSRRFGRRRPDRTRPRGRRRWGTGGAVPVAWWVGRGHPGGGREKPWIAKRGRGVGIGITESRGQPDVDAEEEVDESRPFDTYPWRVKGGSLRFL